LATSLGQVLSPISRFQANGSCQTPANSNFIALANEVNIHLDRVDHKSMCRFGSHDDSNYQRLLQRIRAGLHVFTTNHNRIKELTDWLRSDLDDEI
jgi:hypothetical protein